MVKPSPPAALEVIEADLLFHFLVVALDAPAELRETYRFHESGALIDAATRAGFTDVCVVELHGRGAEGDYVLRAVR